ncbi:MAG TPA: carbon-nitrogen hydrolase family protein [Micromonosporaceae bacterium]|nr:carbon-nitrogen hydrolase family protein [Micromonosporaceae bacterium]
MRTLTVAAVQTKPVPGDLEATWSRFADQVRAVRALWPQVQLVLAPELLLAAVPPLLSTVPGLRERAAGPVPGPTTDRVCALARELGLWLVPGTIFERGDQGRIHNTAVVASPAGELVARYRKVFTWQPYERNAPGRSFVAFDIAGVGRAGLAICYDGSFPETGRQLAWLGAEVVLQPTLTTTRDREIELVCARANAFCNQLFVVSCNAADPASVGQSVVVDPEGIVRQQAGCGEEVLVDVLDLDAVTKARRHGALGLNRPLDQLFRDGPQVELPVYGGATITPPPWWAPQRAR